MVWDKDFPKNTDLTFILHWPYRHARAALGEVDHSWVELVFK